MLKVENKYGTKQIGEDFCTMTKTFTIEKGQKPTEEQLQEVMEAKKQSIVYDEDSPELSPAMYKAFMSSVIQRNRKKNANLN